MTGRTISTGVKHLRTFYIFVLMSISFKVHMTDFFLFA